MATDQPVLAPGSIDPNVHIPDHVKAGSAEADKLHEQYYPKNPEQAPAPAKEAIPQPPQPVQEPPPAPVLEPSPAPPPPVVEPADQDDSWRHKFLSMQGRYQSSSKQIGQMEHQMVELGQELTRTQSLLAAAHQAPPFGQNDRPNHNNLITAEDRDNYGNDLIDLTQRVAKATVGPELEALRTENQNLKKTVNASVKQSLFADVQRAIPQWRQINDTVQWRTWLTLPNLYTGEVRQNMLNRAITGAEAPKVIQLFRDFLAEANATGQTFLPAQAEQQVAPRAPAVPLESLAAPGRARPASGENSAPAEKPIYSHLDIRKFYSDSRKGLYAGRDAEYRAFEADLTLAQAEGRVR